MDALLYLSPVTDQITGQNNCRCRDTCGLVNLLLDDCALSKSTPASPPFPGSRNGKKTGASSTFPGKSEKVWEYLDILGWFGTLKLTRLHFHGRNLKKGVSRGVVCDDDEVASRWSSFPWAVDLSSIDWCSSSSAWDGLTSQEISIGSLWTRWCNNWYRRGRCLFSVVRTL